MGSVAALLRVCFSRCRWLSRRGPWLVLAPTRRGHAVHRLLKVGLCGRYSAACLAVFDRGPRMSRRGPLLSLELVHRPTAERLLMTALRGGRRVRGLVVRG